MNAPYRPDPAATRRSQRRVVLGVGGVVVLATVIAVAAALGAGDGDEGEESARSSTTEPATDPTDPITGGAGTDLTSGGTPVDVPLAPAGEALTGPTPCPATDGTAARVTRFEEAPPLCIDPEVEHKAVIHTDAGDITLLLQPELAPQAVNNFVVLARYHFYDGMAFSQAVPRSHVQAGSAVEGLDDVDPPGYTIEPEPTQSIYAPGAVGLVPASDGTNTGEFFIMTFDRFMELPQDLTLMGQMLDGTDVLRALDELATESGTPSGVITITSIDVTENPLG
jgi:cyclophilin family peptidyl-prolyl cis-trans isomerase